MACVELNKPCGEFLHLEMDMSKKFYGSLVLGAAILAGGQQIAMAANLVVAQQELPVGQVITVANVKYQIMQFEVPAFGSDKTYLLKFPVALDSEMAPGNVSAFVSVYGSPRSVPAFSDDTINSGAGGINGFKAYFDEGYNYNASYYKFSSSVANMSNQLTLSNGIGIQLDTNTYVQLSLANRHISSEPINTAPNPDTTLKLKAQPTARLQSQRNKFIADSRALFKYVSVKLKS